MADIQSNQEEEHSDSSASVNSSRPVKINDFVDYEKNTNGDETGIEAEHVDGKNSNFQGK